MLELLVVAVGVITLVAMAALPIGAAVWGGVALALGSLLVGAVGGWFYHLRLRALLLRLGPLPVRWYWNPMAHHERLSEADEDTLLPSFRVGVAGFVGSMVGCAVAAAGVVRTLM